MTGSLPAEWWRPDLVVGGGKPSAAITATNPKEPGGAVPFWALMSFTFVLLIAPQMFFPVLARFRIALVTAAVAIAAHLFDRFIHRQPVLRLTRQMWIGLGLVAWAVLTVPLSFWPGGSVSFLLDVYLKTLAIFWLLGNTVNTLTKLRRVAEGLTLMGVALAATAVANFLSGSFMPDAKRIVGYEAPLTGNPNDLALMLNLILPLSVALLLTSRRPVVRVGLLAVIILDVVAVVATFSRAGFLVLATTLVAYLWKLLKRPERAWALMAFFFLLVCIPFLPSGYADRLETITNIESDPSGSAQARWNDTVAALSWVLRNPIVGAGAGNNALALNEERGPAWKVVHNAYLEYAVELGIPGLVLFLLLLAGSIKNASFVQRRTARLPPLRELFYLAEGIQMSLVAFAVGALFSPVGYQFYFYYLAGLAVAVKTVCEAEARGFAPDQNRSSAQEVGRFPPKARDVLERR